MCDRHPTATIDGALGCLGCLWEREERAIPDHKNFVLAVVRERDPITRGGYVTQKAGAWWRSKRNTRPQGHEATGNPT